MDYTEAEKSADEKKSKQYYKNNERGKKHYKTQRN